MKVEINGDDVGDYKDFYRLLARAISPQGADPYFGWDMHSLQDCLFGGYHGEPPYHIVVRSAERLLDAFGYVGMALYCRDMLETIEGGGRGLVGEEQKEYFTKGLQAAVALEGWPLLRWLYAVVESAPASLLLLAKDGRELGRVVGERCAEGDPELPA